MKLGAAFALLVLSSPAGASEIVAAVPEQFQGEWAGRLADCGKGLDDLGLRIDSGSIAYYESSGPLKAIVVNGDHEIALIAELSGEGQPWLSPAKFKLSSHGSRLVDETTIPGKAVVRYRCPSSGAP